MRIKVPATSANLGPGFDTLGMALQFYNHFEAIPADVLTVQLSPNTCVDVAGLSLDPEENLLTQAYQAYFKFRNTPLIPAQLTIEAHVPLSRGLGSSSSAIAAGLFLADSLHPSPLGRDALVPWAVTLEGHPDNVVPALLGGVHCCLDGGRSFRLEWPTPWGIVLVIPPHPVSTQEARQVMPSHYGQEEVISNLRGIAAWIHAVEHQDTNLFREALRSDTIHEPFRGKLIPEFQALKQSLSATEALGCVISGSGSTMAVYTPDTDSHKTIFTLLKEASPALAHCKLISVHPDKDGTNTVLKD